MSTQLARITLRREQSHYDGLLQQLRHSRAVLRQLESQIIALEERVDALPRGHPTMPAQRAALAAARSYARLRAELILSLEHSIREQRAKLRRLQGQ